jgi:TonB family protein
MTAYGEDLTRGPRLGGMVILSSILHLIIFFVAIVGPKLFFNKKVFYSPVYTVSLVSLSEKKGPLPSAEPIRETSEERPKEIAPELIPLKKEAVSRIKDAIRRLEALRAIRERHKDTSPPTGDRALEQRGERGSPGTRPSGIATRELLDLRYRLYYNMIWEKIRDAWVLPEGITKGKNLEAIVALRIKRNGTIENYWIEKGSGNTYFDQSAIRAINKADPLPPLPEDFREEIFEVGVRFYP